MDKFAPMFIGTYEGRDIGSTHTGMTFIDHQARIATFGTGAEHISVAIG